jgi:hypothetical protein
MIPMAPFLFMRHEDDNSTWCQEHDCQCPCHRSTWQDSPWFILPCIVFGTLFILWLTFTIYEWADQLSTPPKTLIQILADDWHWLISLMHRIW